MNMSNQDECIRLEMSDWLYNAGIVGLINILKHSEDEIEFNGQEVSFKFEVLENFEEKYFNYFIDIYEKTMIYTKLIEKIEKLRQIEVNKLNMEKVKEDIEYIKSKMKNAAYKDRVNNIELTDLKNPSKNDFNININLLSRLQEILKKEKRAILKSECIGYYDQKAKDSKAPNAIIDKYINTNMLGITQLIDDCKAYFQEEKNDFNLSCFSCEREINRIQKGLSFLNRMFFDTSRKTSNVWNFNTDIEICPICKLIYYCIPAGFTTIYGKGIFINENNNIKNAIMINDKVRFEILKNDIETGAFTYRAFVNALYESINDNTKYELADIQVVRYEEGKYRFNLLSKKILNILYDSKDELNSLLKVGFQEVDTYMKIYEEVIKKLLNNENMFLLIYKLLILKLSKPQNAHYKISHVINVMKINNKFMKGVMKMDITEKDILKSASGAGYYLKEAYKNKSAESKLDGISYRLLNALKTSNKNAFMDTVLNCYLYTGKMVPQIFVDCLKDDVIFKTIGYAFVSGLINGKND